MEGVGLVEVVVDEAAMPVEADERVAEPESGDELVMGEPAQPAKMTSPKQTIIRGIRVVEVPTTRLTLFAFSLDGPFRFGRHPRGLADRPRFSTVVFQFCMPQRHRGHIGRQETRGAQAGLSSGLVRILLGHEFQ